MLNMLRSDLYRLVRLRTFWFLCVAIPCLYLPLGLIYLVVGQTYYVSIKPGDVFGFIPVLAGISIMQLCAQEAPGRAVKSLSNVTHLRQRYIASRFVLLAGATAFVQVLLVASLYLASLLPSISLTTTAADHVLAGSLASIPAFIAISALPLSTCITCGTNSLLYCADIIICLGFGDQAILGALGAIGSLFPALASMCDALASLTLTGIIGALALPETYTAAGMAYVVLVPLIYLVFWYLVTLYSMRKERRLA